MFKKKNFWSVIVRSVEDFEKKSFELLKKLNGKENLRTYKKLQRKLLHIFIE